MGFLIKHSKSDMLMKTPSFLVSPVRLKSPINQIQYWDVSLFKIEDKIIKKVFITLWWRVIEANTDPFLSFDGKLNQVISQSSEISSMFTAL